MDDDLILKFVRDRWKKCLITLLVILICGVSWNTKMDDKASERINTQLKQAAITFAVVRGLNGVISVIQSTEVSAHFIVGGTVTVGEILDPLNDNIERLSWVMLASTASLGIQKLTNELIAKRWISWILTISGVIYLLLLWFVKKGTSGWRLFTGKLFLSLSVLRYAVLLMVLFNHALYLGFFDNEQKNLRKQLRNTTKQISFHPQEESLIDEITNKIEQLIQTARQAFDKIIKLTASFVLQTIILPLLFLWGVAQLLKAIFAYSPSSPN